MNLKSISILFAMLLIAHIFGKRTISINLSDTYYLFNVMELVVGVLTLVVGVIFLVKSFMYFRELCLE